MQASHAGVLPMRIGLLRRLEKQIIAVDNEGGARFGGR